MRLVKAGVIAAVLAGPGSAAAAETPVADTGTALVYLADQSSVPLQSWSLSYAYVAWKEGTAQEFNAPQRRDSNELWLGKRSLPLRGRTLVIRYRTQGPGGTEIALSGPGGAKEETFKPDPPARERLLEGAGKGWLVTARGLDLRGQTLTGTRRDFCLLSFSSLVQCSSEPSERVVKVEFQP